LTLAVEPRGCWRLKCNNDLEEKMTFLRRLFRSNKPQIFGGWQY